MHIPPHFAETNPAVLHALIRSHPLGAWVTLGADELVVNHIPFVLDPERGTHGTLIGHVARANPVWRSSSPGVPSVVVFQGPQSYITPSWYPAKREHGKVVPTWNYAVVHAHGVPRSIEDRDWLLAQISRLSEEHEAQQPRPWKLADAPPEYIAGLLAGVVGIEIPIDRLEGKWKVSQNRPTTDRHGVVTGLRASGTASAVAMAQLVEARIPPAAEP